jgi:4-hydroxyphenylpyruvate dioxygenase
VIAAVALRVRDAAAAYQRALERGAWAVPTQVEVMELNIPAIHGAGTSRIYFVDRYKEFSIYDVDFVPIPTVDQRPPALAGLHFFGIVQYIGVDRWTTGPSFYRELFGFDAAGRAALRHPAQGPHPAQPVPQLLPAADRARAGHADLDGEECLQRMGLGTPTCWRPWPRCASAAWTLSIQPACRCSRPRCLTNLAGRRDVRAGAHRR